MRVGSDGVQACATCHFHAGADGRTKNQSSPGFNRISGTNTQIAASNNPNVAPIAGAPDFTFDTPGVNGQLAQSHYGPTEAQVAANPLTTNTNPRRGDPLDKGAKPRQYGVNDIISSQGVHQGSFNNVQAGRADAGTYNQTDTNGFQLDATHTSRRVEPRNTPTTIMAGYNLRNFWDGRANMYFNGVNPFGMLDPSAVIQTTNATGGTLAGAGTTLKTDQQVMLPFSSLASQAVGPPGSPFEMSLDGRAMRNIGSKLLTLNNDVPLDGQVVSSSDSALGAMAHVAGDHLVTGDLSSPLQETGLKTSYKAMIQDIFQPKFWNGPSSGGLTLMENNFGLFFGVAIQAYEQTLVPDQTPLDPILAFMTPQIQAGVLPDAALTNAFNAPSIPNSTLSLADRQILVTALRVFLTPQSNCFVCHVGAEFTGATVSTLTGFGRPVAAPLVPPAVPEAIALIERMIMGDGNTGVYDSGYYNIGVRPTSDDLSIFNRTPGNVPFSVGMLQQDILRGTPSVAPVAALLRGGTLKQPAAAIGFPTFSVDLSPVAQTGFALGCAPPAPNAKAIGIVGGQACQPLAVNERLAIRGAFKSSTLRNTKFMGPYFHNGGRSNVTDVIANHYNRGGVFNMAFNPDNCGVKPNGLSSTSGCLIGQVDFDAAIIPLGLNQAQINGIANLIQFGLTDDRVAKEKAPFDHPELCVPVGHTGTATVMAEVAPVGGSGNASDLPTFEQSLVGGTAVHNLSVSCAMPAFSGGLSAHPRP